MRQRKRVGKESGHPYFHELTDHEKDLHGKKSHDYSKGGHPLGNFLRVSEFLKLYPGLDHTDPAIIAMIYGLKQLDAYLWIKANKITTKVEGLNERLTDLSIYAKLVQCIEHDNTAGPTRESGWDASVEETDKEKEWHVKLRGTPRDGSYVADGSGNRSIPTFREHDDCVRGG